MLLVRNWYLAKTQPPLSTSSLMLESLRSGRGGAQNSAALDNFMAALSALIDHLQKSLVCGSVSALESSSEKPITEVSGLFNSCATPATITDARKFFALN